MIYLDNAATSFPKPEVVYQTLDRFARTQLANPGRAGHKMAVEAEHALDEGRHALNQFFHGPGPEHWIFTLNGTDALNMAIKGIVEPGDHVITSDLEHNSVSRPLVAMEQAGQISLTRLTSTDGYLDPSQVRDALTERTRLVALTHAANVLGTIQPIPEIAAIVADSPAHLLVDAAQSVGVVPIDLRQFPIDLLAFPGHKALYGPTGTGVLFVAPHLSLKTWREGGTGGDSSSPVQPDLRPYLYEGGTPNVLGVAGLTAGIRWVAEQGPDQLRNHEVGLLQKVVDWVDSAEGWRIAGRWDPETHVGALSLIVPNVLPPQEIGAILDTSFALAIRPGLHCAPYVHRNLGTYPDGTVRLSPGAFSTESDIDSLINALGEITAGVL